MNAISVINPHPPAPSFSMGEMERIALAIAKGGLFGSNDPNAVLTLCMLAQAENKHPALIMQNYHIIKGKPAKKADAMLVDFLGAGGRVEWHALTDDIADATFSHPQGGCVRISWDKARVVQAEIGSNPMHKKYPRQMLRARTISEGVRTVFPGATSGMYVPEEVADFADAAPARAAPPMPQPTRARDMPALTERQRDDTPEPPATDSKRDASRKWLNERLAQIAAMQDVSSLAELDAKHAANVPKIEAAYPEWAGEFGAAMIARVAELTPADALGELIGGEA